MVIIIPARYYSTRFEGKPLAKINGKPMIQHVYERAASIYHTVVATDDKRIADCVRPFGTVVMTDSGCKSGTDRVAEAANLMELGNDEIVVNVQGDQPLFEPDTIRALVKPFADSALPMTTLACEMVQGVEDSNHVKVVFDNYNNALYFSRAVIPCQRDYFGPPPRYYKHLGFYAYRKWFLSTFSANLPEGGWEQAEKLEQLRALEHGYDIQVVTTKHDSVEVDTPDDIKRVEGLL